MKKPLLITEHNGHMFPTKSFDPWQKRQEHALRHARVQSDAAADGLHAGCIGWCMFDYATHKDFGSGDRICYHGVLDSFRNPKLAAAVYASQQEKRPVLAVGSPMDIGDYAAGNIGQVSVFTNADEVALYKNGLFVSKLSKGDWAGLPHGPMVLDDKIGCLLEKKEAEDLYRVFGRAMREMPPKWRILVLSSHTEFERCFGRPADKKRKLYNGMLKCDVFQYGK